MPGRSVGLEEVMENDEVVLRNILSELVDLFGWSDSTPLHAALHIRNAVLNMRADLAVERARAVAAWNDVSTAAARAEAAEKRAEALAHEVAQLRADRAITAVLAVMAMGSDAREVLPADSVPLMVALRAQCLAVLPGAQSEDVGSYARAMFSRIEAEAQPAGEVSDG